MNSSDQTLLDHQRKQGYTILHNALMPLETTTTTGTPYLQSSNLQGGLPSTQPNGDIPSDSEPAATTELCDGVVCYDFWDTAWFNFTNGSGIFDSEGNWIHEDVRISSNWYVLLLVVVVFAGVTGNLLVCIAITIERKLQNVTNYFLLSLSIADLFVCFFVMPCSIVNELMGKYQFYITFKNIIQYIS